MLLNIVNPDLPTEAYLFCQLTIFFNLNDMQSMAISITCHGAFHKAYCPNARHPKAPN